MPWLLTSFMKREKLSRMNTERLRIKSVRELVDAFGGTGKLAAFLKVVPSSVSNMLAEDYIPRGYHLELYLEARERGWEIDLSKVFGLSRPPSPKRRAEVRAA